VGRRRGSELSSWLRFAVSSGRLSRIWSCPLELVEDVVLRCQVRLLGLDGGFGGHLLTEGDLGEAIGLVASTLFAAARNSSAFREAAIALLPQVLASFTARACSSAAIPRLPMVWGDGGLGLDLADVVRVFADHLAQHLLRVFRGVQAGVQVDLGELGHAVKILCFTGSFYRFLSRFLSVPLVPVLPLVLRKSPARSPTSVDVMWPSLRPSVRCCPLPS
jgi:hypothetical protein